MSFKLLQLKKFSDTIFLKEKFIIELKILERPVSCTVPKDNVDNVIA
jgi:hypothetical protein